MKIEVHDDINDIRLESDLKLTCRSTGLIISCKVNSTLIAILSYTKNYFHPYSLELHFKFFESVNDSQILNFMFNKLKSELANSNFILKLESDDTIYNEFILNNNFREIRKTYEPELSITTMLEYYKCSTSHPHYNKQSFTMTNNLVVKVYEVYKSTHRANPVGNIGMEEWKNIISKDLDLNHSIVIYSCTNEVIAYLFIFDYSKDKKDVGWIYFKNETAKNLLLDRFINILYQLQETGISSLCFEIDNTDPYSSELFAPFLNDISPSVISYMNSE